MSLRNTLALVLACFATKAVGQTPNLAPSQMLPGDATPGAAPGIQRYAAVARGGASFLAVWSDYRTNPAGTALIAAQTASDVFGMRLDATGAPIDAVAFPIGLALGEQPRARVAWNGENWLVVWASQEPTASFYATKLRAARVSPQGVVLDAAPFLVLDYELFAETLFSVSSDGANWLVAIEGTQGELRGVRVSPQGAVLDPAGVQLYAGSSSLLQSMDLAFSGGEYMLVWEELVGFNWTIRARRFTPALGNLDPLPKTIAPNANHAKIAGNGAEFFVVWQSGPVFGSRVSLAGTVLTPGGVNLSGATPFGPEPQVSWDGTQWLATWMGFGPGSPAPTSTQVARVSAAGAVLDFGGVAIDAFAPGDKSDPAVAGGAAGGGVVVWTDRRAGGINPEDVFAASFSAAGAAGAGTAASRSAPMQTAPRFAFNGHGYLAVFRSELSGVSKILAQRLDVSGAAIDAQPFEVASGSVLRTPAVAWNGSVVLVAWSEGTTSLSIRARRMTSGGAFLDLAPFTVMPGSAPDVAALGDQFLVVGVHAPANPEFKFPFSRRVSALDGSLLDAAPVQVGGSFAVDVQVETLGDEWVVAWEEHVTHDESLASIRVNTVDALGAPRTATTIGSNNHAGFSRVGLAASGTTALVTWESNFGAAMNALGRIVRSGGLPATPVLTLSSAPNAQRRTAAGWDGTQYVVDFEDQQMNSIFFDARTDVFATRVLENGTVLDPAGFAAFVSDVAAIDASAAGAGFGRSLLAASVFHPESPFAGYRVETREMRPAGLASFGAGTPGCFGPQTMDANGTPQVGAAGFTLLCDAAPPSALGFVVLGNGSAPNGIDFLGIGVPFLVNLFTSTTLIGLDALSDPAGFGVAPAPIPNDPALAGATLYGQTFWAWGGVPCFPSPFGLSASNGLQITFVP